MPSRNGKGYYSEVEAARTLGVSVEELRTLIKLHIVESEEDLTNVPMATFQPSDLLLLKLLSGKSVAPTDPS